MATTEDDEKARQATYTRRQFMEYSRIMEGEPGWTARQAVATAALEHPDWELEEEMTWAEWNERRDQGDSEEPSPR
jgi:hypothetical protein